MDRGPKGQLSTFVPFDVDHKPITETSESGTLAWIEQTRCIPNQQNGQINTGLENLGDRLVLKASSEQIRLGLKLDGSTVADARGSL